MNIDVDYLLNNSELDKEEVEKLGSKEVRASFRRAIDKANSFGVRKINYGEVSISGDTTEIDLSSLPNFEYHISVVKAVYLNDVDNEIPTYDYRIIYRDKPILKYRYSFQGGSKVYIVYTSALPRQDVVDVSSSDVEILTLIFEGTVYEKLADMYAKTGEGSLEADITNYIEKSRFYQERATRRYDEARKIIKVRIPTGKYVQMQEIRRWLTH